ncbi:MAG: glycerol-3-phosphate 1-O-acyltransferase PlsY [Clostridia bacterium]|nr:glycerol-3-phosphate 1-O-acyltransferase PlsY [Clostridia bacterium]
MFLVWGIYNLFENGLLRVLLSTFQPNENITALWIGLAFAFCIIASYLLGSVNCALVISRLFYHDDIRDHGSGNAGTTNILRSYGKKAAILTFLGDGLKGILSILIACLIFGHPTSEYYYIYLVTACYLSAFFCIFGHVFPCFSRFRGGKGFATMAVSILCLNPFIGLILAVIFFPLVLMTRYVSLGSVVTALFYPILLSSFDSITVHYGISSLIAILIAALVTWAHRGNLKRIFDRTERKLSFGHKEPVTSAAEGTVDATPEGTASEPKKKQPMSRKKQKRLKKRK